MTHLPITDNATRSIKSALRRSDETAAERPRFTMTATNLFVIFVFCAIGLLTTLNVMLRFPDFGIDVEQLARFLG